jgi:hypothetical protein
MTTDSSPGRAWKLYAVALLAAAYVAVWLAFARPPRRTAVIAPVPPVAVTAPPGWQLATETKARPTVAPVRARPRLRTRSS